MKCKEIIELIENEFPMKYAESWDNTGFQVGNREKEVSHVFVAMDVTDENIDEAIRVGADMIVTVRSNEDVIDWGATGNERIIQNVRNLIRTRKYEVPFMREMGLSPDLIDSSLNKIKGDITTGVIELINTYESRVSVLDVSVETVDGSGDCVIAVKMEV